MARCFRDYYSTSAVKVNAFIVQDPGACDEDVYKRQGYEKEAAAVYGKCYSPFGTGERRQVLGYLTCDQEPTAYDAQKNAFIGTYGAEIAPKAVLGGGCTNSDCMAEK